MIFGGGLGEQWPTLDLYGHHPDEPFDPTMIPFPAHVLKNIGARWTPYELKELYRMYHGD